MGSVVLNLLGLALPLSMLQIFDRIISNGASETLLALVLVLATVALLEFALRIARIVLVSEDGARFERQLGASVLRRILAADPAAIEAETLGRHMERLGVIPQLRDARAGPARMIRLDLAFSAVFIATIFTIGGPLVVVPLGVCGLMLLVAATLRRRQVAVLDQRSTLDGVRYSFLIEYLSQIETVKSQTMERQMARRFERLQARSTEASRDIVRLSGRTKALMAVLGQTATAAMGLGGAALVIGGQLGLGGLAACMLLNGRAVQPALRILTIWIETEHGRRAEERMAQLEGIALRPVTAAVPKVTGRIELRALACPPHIRAATGAVAAGSRVWLSGASASAARAFFAALLAERAPVAGALSIDGLPPEALIGARGPGAIVHADGEPRLFAGTILENLTLFGLAPDPGYALECADRIGLGPQIRSLPLGYDTPLGQAQGFRAAGLRQLVGLTAAIALQPRLLLLEDPVSAVGHASLGPVASVLRTLPDAPTTVLYSSRKALCDIATAELVLGEDAGVERSVAAWDADREADRVAAAAQARWPA